MIVLGLAGVSAAPYLLRFLVRRSGPDEDPWADAGFAERGFHRAHDWWVATRDAMVACECAEGCPSCVQSPKCGNQNQPLDKAAAIDLLGILLAHPD